MDVPHRDWRWIADPPAEPAEMGPMMLEQRSRPDTSMPEDWPQRVVADAHEPCLVALKGLRDANGRRNPDTVRSEFLRNYQAYVMNGGASGLPEWAQAVCWNNFSQGMLGNLEPDIADAWARLGTAEQVIREGSPQDIDWLGDSMTRR